MANVDSIQLTSSEYIQKAKKQIQTSHSKVNVFALPKIAKIVINVGVGKVKDNKVKQDIADYLYKLTAQTPKKVPSKVSIASFKLRKGETVGLMTTLRGKKAEDFLMQLIFIALPRTRDFKGIKQTAFDSNYSCYSLGIENASIFPTIGFDVSVPFGMQINLSFNHSTPLNKDFLEALNFPFKK
jgi:large subunit ribosomal protein L5